MTPFDKSFPKYEKLSDYFVGLASAFQIDNEVSVTDEEDTDTETKLTVNWTLTLTNLVTNYTERRTADINVRLVLKSGTWKIVDFTPIDMFNPQQKRAAAVRKVFRPGYLLVRTCTRFGDSPFSFKSSLRGWKQRKHRGSSCSGPAGSSSPCFAIDKLTGPSDIVYRRQLRTQTDLYV